MTSDTALLNLPPPLSTSEQALNWAEVVVGTCEESRKKCDVPLDRQATTTVQELRRREAAYYIQHGNALGVVSALMRIGLIDAVAYNAFVTRVQNTLLASAVPRN